MTPLSAVGAWFARMLASNPAHSRPHPIYERDAWLSQRGLREATPDEVQHLEVTTSTGRKIKGTYRANMLILNEPYDVLKDGGLVDAPGDLSCVASSGCAAHIVRL
jgi:hypothetical protein